MRAVPADDAEALDAGPDETSTAPTTVALHESPETRLVVIGDSAFLSDFVARMIGQVDGNFFVENLRFIENVIDWTTLDSDMMAIRARGLASRRLDRTAPRTQIGPPSHSPWPTPPSAASKRPSCS